MTFTLPWPPNILNPNARPHWSAKARAVKKYRSDASLMAKMARSVVSGPQVSIVFRPPNKRRRDLDNCLASFKAGLDGIADAFCIDDSKFVVTMRMGDPVKNGEVEVTMGSSISGQDRIPGGSQL